MCLLNDPGRGTGWYGGVKCDSELPVPKTDEYAVNALATLELAERAGSPDAKGRLFRLAEGWLDLADRAEKRRSVRTPTGLDHPVVTARLGDEHTDP
jgi:hypothetical protein